MGGAVSSARLPPVLGEQSSELSELSAPEKESAELALRALCRQREQDFRMRLLDLARQSRGGLGADPALTGVPAASGDEPDQPQPPMWLSTPLGEGITIHDEGRVVSHQSTQGWTTQLLDGWMTKGETTIELLIEQIPLSPNFFIGMVGHNFTSGDAPLAQSKHAVAMHATGTVTHKGVDSALVMPLPRATAAARSPTRLARRPSVVHPGARVHVIVDMLRREMCLEMMSSSGSGTNGEMVADRRVASCLGYSQLLSAT
jgi:hypothetical protein